MTPPPLHTSSALIAWTCIAFVAVLAIAGEVLIASAMRTIGEATANPGDIHYDSVHNMLFLADTSGTLTIFHRDSSTKYSKLQEVKTRPGARTMIISQQDAKAYLVTSKFGQNTGAVSEELKFRPTPIPGTFSVLVVGR